MRTLLGLLGLAVSLLPAHGEFLPLGTGPVIFRKLGTPLVLGTETKVTRWFLIRPVLRALDNVTDQPPGTVVPITYRLEPLEDTGQTLDAQPLIDALGTGTVYVAAWGGRHPAPLEIRESQALHLRYPGCVVQVVARAGDSYLDYLHELDGTPFLMGPGVVDHRHQTDERQGSDCAALAIYGKRRMGFDVRYGGPQGILTSLDALAPHAFHPDAQGIYRDETGKTFSTEHLQPGDIFHFGQQVSVFVEDGGAPGLLDVGDVVFESWGDHPRQTTIRASDFTRFPLRLYRWKETLPRK